MNGLGHANQLAHHVHVMHPYSIDSYSDTNRNRGSRPAEAIVRRWRLTAPIRSQFGNERFPRRTHKYTVSGLSETPKRT